MADHQSGKPNSATARWSLARSTTDTTCGPMWPIACGSTAPSAATRKTPTQQTGHPSRRRASSLGGRGSSRSQSAARQGDLHHAGRCLGARCLEVLAAGRNGRRSLRAYDDFYAHLQHLLDRLVARHGKVVVFDLHSYNHMRGGAGGVAADPEGNPEVNLGTGTMARSQWSPMVDRWLDAMREYDYLGRRLDVRENVKFFGGQLPRWIHENFPNSVCVLGD